jgi:hypothetical protein
VSTSTAPPADLVRAAERTAHLGFLLVSPFPPGARDAELVVSIRREPTAQHFDPEVVRFWRTGQDRRGHPIELEFGSALPVSGTFAWGKIELVDRFGVENCFVTHGGTFQADRLGDQKVLAMFRSPAPILRMGGHSQSADEMALELAAFFGRVMVPIDFDPGVEEAIAAADPLTRYAAFVAFTSERYRSHVTLRLEHAPEAEVISEEALRLRTTRPDAWMRGTALLERLNLRR